MRKRKDGREELLFDSEFEFLVNPKVEGGSWVVSSAARINAWSFVGDPQGPCRVREESDETKIVGWVMRKVPGRGEGSSVG
jgi:hypothetical protein